VQLHQGTPTKETAPSGRLFTSRTVSPEISYAAANRVLETPPADTPRQKNTADKCTDGDMVTLITSYQQIMAGLKTADTEEVRFAVYGLIMQQ
jgi:hypothetical protein